MKPIIYFDGEKIDYRDGTVADECGLLRFTLEMSARQISNLLKSFRQGDEGTMIAEYEGHRQRFSEMRLSISQRDCRVTLDNYLSGVC